jgi:hypothetical protein
MSAVSLPSGCVAGFPAQFGKYLLLESVSRVGDREVYKAKVHGIEGFEKVLAVRRLFAPTVDSQTVPGEAQERDTFAKRRDRFVEQARLLSALHHNGIVQVFDMGQVDGEYYYAMEYVSGISVHTAVSMARTFSYPMPGELVVYVALQLAKTFDYVYRSLDSLAVNLERDELLQEDIMIGFEGEVKLLQFDLPQVSDLKRLVRALADDTPLGLEVETWLAESVTHEHAFGQVFAELSRIARLFPRAGARELGQYMRGLKLRPAVRANLESAYDREHAKTALEIGSMWLLQGQDDKAIPLLIESYTAARKLRLEHIEHRSLRALAWLDFLRFGSEEGMEYFVTAKDWLEQHGTMEDSAHNLCYQAAIEWRRGNETAARQLVQEATAMATEQRLGKVLEHARLMEKKFHTGAQSQAESVAAPDAESAADSSR